VGRKITQAVSCPECGLAAKDPDLARLGFCTRCQEFTGMCAAGRKVVCRDIMRMTSWHLPCTDLGTTEWQVSHDGTTYRTRLCSRHDAEVRAGGTPWLESGVWRGLAAR
jgi:hypothetical protein